MGNGFNAFQVYIQIKMKPLNKMWESCNSFFELYKTFSLSKYHLCNNKNITNWYYYRVLILDKVIPVLVCYK